jgi:hypothetical protein
MTRTFQPNPLLEFAAEMEARDARETQMRAQIRATNHVDPRCSICRGRFIGDIAEVIEFARLDDLDLPGFDKDDLVCAMCWCVLGEETWGTA